MFDSAPRLTRHLWFFLGALAVGVSCSSAKSAAADDKPRLPPIPPGVSTTEATVHLPTEGEVRIGRESALEVERDIRVVRDGPYHERLQRVSSSVARAVQLPEIAAEYRRVYRLPKKKDEALRVPFEYSFKVVNMPGEVNAFSLAGGPIYVTKALMDFTTSDHELAGVLAHECVHVAFHHVEQLIRKQRKLNTAQLWSVLAAVVAGAAGNSRNVGLAPVAAQLLSVAAINGYGRELEFEADRVAVQVLERTEFSAVGVLTMLSKFAREERRHGNPDWGIYQSHPFGNERETAIRAELARMNYRVDTGIERQVSQTYRIDTVLRPSLGKEVAEVRLNGNVLVSLRANDGSLTPSQRARAYAERINSLLAEGLSIREVSQDAVRGAVLMKGVTVIRLFPEDLTENQTLTAAVDQVFREILRAMLQEQIDRG